MWRRKCRARKLDPLSATRNGVLVNGPWMRPASARAVSSAVAHFRGAARAEAGAGAGGHADRRHERSHHQSSLYLQDPNGNEVELYVDADEAFWKNDPTAVLSPIKRNSQMIVYGATLGGDSFGVFP